MVTKLTSHYVVIVIGSMYFNNYFNFHGLLWNLSGLTHICPDQEDCLNF